MLFMRDRSIIRPPLHTAFPLMLCSPPFIESRVSCSCANWTGATTSAAPAQRAIIAGLRSVSALKEQLEEVRFAVHEAVG
jgi:hypothetical protein